MPARNWTPLSRFTRKPSAIGVLLRRQVSILSYPFSPLCLLLHSYWQHQSLVSQAARDWNELNQEKNDKKNEYLLSVTTLNALKNKHYHSDMSTLMDV